MFGSIGIPELIVILVVALLVFGPRRLPEIGKTIGKAIREFKKASRDIQDQFMSEIEDDRRKQYKVIDMDGEEAHNVYGEKGELIHKDEKESEDKEKLENS